MISIRVILIILLFSTVSCNNDVSVDNIEPAIKTIVPIVNEELVIEEDSIISSKLDSIFSQALFLSTISGAAISIVQGNQVLFMKTYGYKDAASKTPLTTKSVFRLGSVSKSITGIVSGILYQRGDIDFKENIFDYDEDFTLHNLKFSKSLKLSHLLSHTSGLPYHSFTNLIEYGVTLNKIVCKFSDILNLEAPGDVYSYQNAAFAESGEIISRKLSRPIQDIYKQVLFDPIGMNNASLTYKDLRNAPDIARPHKKAGKKWVPQPINKKYYNAIPAGGVNASIEDMTKILKLLLANSPTLLSSATIDTITTPRINTKVKYRYYKKWDDFENSFYGYGWRIHTFNNPDSMITDTLFHHGGQVNNYRSEIAFDKKEDIAICVLFNSYTPLANTIIPDLFSIVKAVR